ncbi:MAG: hypothetical protein KVP17_004462 [Porospora cf. gigantea B]|uniref:uncharacterized protein n=2 Tax=Porospora cf. gigantea B TaxID=2853592 RepID=UPI003571DC8A|nr:MAG: hypothetical protein KVP17_004462 [Porospora cf. gigantea B]
MQFQGETAMSMGAGTRIQIEQPTGYSEDPRIRALQQQLVEQQLQNYQTQAQVPGAILPSGAHQVFQPQVPAQMQLHSIEQQLVALQQSRLQQSLARAQAERATEPEAKGFDVFEEGFIVPDADDPDVDFGFGGQPVSHDTQAPPLPIIGFSIPGKGGKSVFGDIPAGTSTHEMIDSQMKLQMDILSKMNARGQLGSPLTDQQLEALHSKLLLKNVGVDKQAVTGAVNAEQVTAHQTMTQQMLVAQREAQQVASQAAEEAAAEQAAAEQAAVQQAAAEEAAAEQAATQQAPRSSSRQRKRYQKNAEQVNKPDSSETGICHGYEKLIKQYTVPGGCKVNRTHLKTFELPRLATGVDQVDRLVEESYYKHSRKIDVWRMSSEIQLMYFTDFVTKQEIRALLALCNDWKPSKTSSGATGSSVDDYTAQESSSQTSMVMRFQRPRHPLVDRLEKRAAAVLGVSVEHIESLKILRYEVGQFFKVHHDGDFRGHTFLVYLNDVEEGGETEFPCLNVDIKPTRGVGVLFGNCKPDGSADWRMLHAAKPVIKGVKYCIPFFVNHQAVNFNHDE